MLLMIYTGVVRNISFNIGYLSTILGLKTYKTTPIMAVMITTTMTGYKIQSLTVSFKKSIKKVIGIFHEPLSGIGTKKRKTPSAEKITNFFISLEDGFLYCSSEV